MASPVQLRPDVLIAGAGIIGVSLALQLQSRGLCVEIVEPYAALRGASQAAAGMLAVNDPHNPPALHPLASLSAGLYPAFLARLERLAHTPIPFQTDSTVQYLRDGSTLLLPEHSLDPRQLSTGLRFALHAAGIALHESAGELRCTETPGSVQLRSANGLLREASRLVHTSGAWFAGSPHVVAPRKGQMLRVQLPASLPLREVHRREDIYIVPRTSGPQAGTALIGATVEDAGFDLSTHPEDLARLRSLAAELLPELGDPAAAPPVEHWAGLRPATRDGLPLLGPMPGSAHQWIATGHFRNGILLAPATAQVMADLLLGLPPGVDLTPFRPARFNTPPTT